MNYIIDRDPGDENDTVASCGTCGDTAQPLSRSIKTGEVSCGTCIFDRGNAAAVRLAAAPFISIPIPSHYIKGNN